MDVGLSVDLGLDCSSRRIPSKEKCAAKLKNGNIRGLAKTRRHAMPIDGRSWENKRLSRAGTRLFLFCLVEKQGGDAHEVIGDDGGADQ